MLTSKLSVVGQRLHTLLEAKIGDTGFIDPAIQGVSYGDQIKVPRVPWVCVDASSLQRQWPPTATDMTQNTLEADIFIYHMNGADGLEQAKIEADLVGEAIMDFININHRTLKDALGNDLVIYSYVHQMESGFTRRDENTLYRAVRLGWRGLSKTQLRTAQ